MIEGLWAAEFQASTGFVGAGVVVFETGRVFGGDGQYFYLGSYEIQGGQADARIKVRHYAGLRSSVFESLDEFELQCAGAVSDQVMNITGSIVNQPQMRIAMRLRKIADLP